MVSTNDIVSKGMVTRVSNKLDHSVGLTIRGVSSIDGIGVISNTESTLPVYSKIRSKESPLLKKRGWYLEAGMYVVVFNEGCNIPKMHIMSILQKAELIQSGAHMYPVATEMAIMGFKTEYIKMILHVTNPIFIEKGIVLCKAFVNEENA